MSKHTPGPWVVDAEDNRILATDKRETIICSLSATCRNPGVLADAHLIAAAPDMLAALIKIRDDAYDQPTTDELTALIERAS